MLLILAAFASPPRGIVLSGKPGGFLSMPGGNFIDSTSGTQYLLLFISRESSDAAGVGQATVQLLGPGISVCSTHGPGADIGTSTDGENFAGNNPLPDIQCGTSYGMAVSIDGCTAKTELHGYSHSDYPLIAYMGQNTVELTFQKTSSSGGKVTMKIYTPKGPIKLDGNVSGDVQMDTCP
jgi:hypothetical protein